MVAAALPAGSAVIGPPGTTRRSPAGVTTASEKLAATPVRVPPARSVWLSIWPIATETGMSAPGAYGAPEGSTVTSALSTLWPNRVLPASSPSTLRTAVIQPAGQLAVGLMGKDQSRSTGS
jgi:hypothetical protein